MAPKRTPLLALVGVLLLLPLSVVLALPANAAASLTATYQKVQDWGTGFEGKFTIQNTGSTSADGWRVEFDFASNIQVGTYWDALVAEQPDNHYTATNRSYNGTIRAGGSVSFGFIGSYSGSYADPTGCTVNGAPCSGGPGGPDEEPPTTPTNLQVTGTTSSSISLSWNPSSDNVGVTGYRVYEGGSVVATSDTTSATVGGLAPESTHTYRVRAFDAAGNESGLSNEETATTDTGGPGPGTGAMAAAPYLYFGWGNPPSPSTVMQQTGVRWFTLAFILSDGGCRPAWDGNRPLTGSDATRIQEIRAAGGDVIPSVGGWAGAKLGERCSTAQSLANAYQQVIDAYDLKAIDIDIENTEFESEAAQDRVLGALRIVEQNNPGITTIVTMPSLQSGLNWWGQRMVRRAVELGAPVDVWTIMPFNFGGGGGDMGQLSIQASENLHAQLSNAYPGRSDADIYRSQGISSMNGRTDVGEMVNQGDFEQMLAYAEQHSLGRFTFWSVNRDRPCTGGDPSACSGISQQPWDFTKIVARYGG